ncbi:SDR family NAD(P)-dependent oxidoreductase [Actinomadura decatromicini]|uniref:SDR family NAD(P)-dependent oxidoreductase n=1 Tax=Actinomadura decatromicini TaxID=2604572 RepID=A0A5D3FRG1_9ACTN|nr:SDR family NAD(P)-dependent oxidoreductase [Actinomadura decatromicini]TYK50689.1 SDR family NAD(P)-dependent oxidoreductase [Actinomadura decatromicini]
MRPIEEQTILITGATDGLGRALAAELAAEGATVLVHGRDDQRGKATLQEIGGRASWYRADLSSLDETRALAEAVRADHPRLDVLVNNAGIGADGPRRESADGHELTFQVNYLSGYLLTRLLLPTLISSAPARIVNVSSLGQQAIDFDDVMLHHGFSGIRAYCQSKLAQVLFTIDLADELAGTGVTANALHPATYMPTKMVSSPISTLKEGVRATHRLVTDPALDDVSGRFFNGLRESRADDQAYDPAARAQLRALSEKLTSA